ncbi:UNVERIFIED_CONTAM: hypothetical protein GTU68_028776 [Idotea baltica]|nr:hypothetical protein [Idotea baltica]
MEFMDTSDEWIQERTGIKERHYGEKHKETTTTMGARASEIAIKRAGIDKEDIDFIIFATLSPDYYFPGCGVLLQRELGITKTEIGALDIRNQCSGFVYGMTVADQFIKSGMYKNILLVGAEMHSMGLDFTTEGRGVTVIFGDGAGAVVLQRNDDENCGVLAAHLHSDGTHAEELAMDQEYGGIFVTQTMLDEGQLFPNMTGQLVFKKAVQKFPEVIMESLNTAGLETKDISILIPHQANLRIAQFIQRILKLTDDQVFNNIEKYGNTTAASIPIALCEAWELGKIKDGDIVCLAAFGSGFTWGSVLIKW